MNHRYVCCLQTLNCRCLYVNFKIPVYLLVQFCPLSMPMNCYFTYLIQYFLFVVFIVSVQSYKSQNVAYDLNDSGCAPPWMQISDGCYLFSNESETWEKGKEFCSNRSSYLVEIGSRLEQLSLAGKLHLHGYR